jgi:hypothetical protein
MVTLEKILWEEIREKEAFYIGCSCALGIYAGGIGCHKGNRVIAVQSFAEEPSCDYAGIRVAGKKWNLYLDMYGTEGKGRCPNSV